MTTRKHESAMKQQQVKREKVPATSGDLLEQQVAKLRQLFPEVVAEGKINFDKLKAALGTATESGPGRFSFTWAGKDDAIALFTLSHFSFLTSRPQMTDHGIPARMCTHSSTGKGCCSPIDLRSDGVKCRQEVWKNENPKKPEDRQALLFRSADRPLDL